MPSGDKTIAQRHGFHKNPERINRNGRPKGVTRATIVKKWLDLPETITNPVTGQLEQVTQEDAITLNLLRIARTGKGHTAIAAYQALMDSRHGKPVKEIELSDPDNVMGGRVSIPAFRWTDGGIIDITPENLEHGDTEDSGGDPDED